MMEMDQNAGTNRIQTQLELDTTFRDGIFLPPKWVLYISLLLLDMATYPGVLQSPPIRSGT